MWAWIDATPGDDAVLNTYSSAEKITIYTVYADMPMRTNIELNTNTFSRIVVGDHDTAILWNASFTHSLHLL